MIRCDTGTPGAGKTLVNVKDIIDLEKTNKKNLILNTKIYDSNHKILSEKTLLSELQYLTRKVGQGVDLKEEALLFEPLYFDLFKTITRHAEYFARSIYYNEIIERLNKENDLHLNILRPVRTIYTNIAGLEIEAVQPIPPDADWRKFPDGSYVVYDEIQNIPIFSSENKSVDPIVKELTIHRHRGFDIIGITQFPELVHKNFRALVGHHRHLVNSFGLKRSTMYEWSTIKMDPNAFRNKATAEIKTTFAFPKEIYKYYRSATAHTHKRRLPWRFIIIFTSVLLFLFIVFSLTFSGDNNFLKKITTGDSGQKQQTPNDKNPDKSQTNTPKQDLNIECRKGENVEKPECVEWFNNLTKNNANANGSDKNYSVSYDPAKPFDNENIQQTISYEVTSKPVFSGCMKKDGKYLAYTEQGTLLKVDQNDCKKLIENNERPYNYFKEKNNVSINTQVSTTNPIQQNTKRYLSQEITQANNSVEPELQQNPINGANSL